MNIDLVRKIDRGAGVPLCFLLTFYDRLLRMFRPPPAGVSSPRKILFVKFSELGAIVLAHPLMDHLRHEYPEAAFYFVSFARNRELLKMMSGLVPDKNVFLIREDPLGFFADILGTLRGLRREKIDRVFDLEFFSRISAIFSYLVGAPRRIGFYSQTGKGPYRGDLLTDKVAYDPSQHIVNNYLAMGLQGLEPGEHASKVPSVTGSGDLVFPKYVSKETVRKAVIQKLQRYGVDVPKRKIFLMNAGEGMLPLREWPLENFIALASRILEDKENVLVIVGTYGAEKKSVRLVSAVANTACLDLVGQTTLEELLELFTLSDTLVSNDCGLAHLAMLTPIRTVTIFGPESPRIFGAPSPSSRVLYAGWPCSPCFSVLNHRQSHCRSNRCLQAITVREVWRSVVGA